ncbi:MAG: response regulator transcription factor [Planctomycetota bacterium]
MRVLIVDGDPASRRYTSRALEESGIEYEAIDCTTQARGALTTDRCLYDVVLIDGDRLDTKCRDLLVDLRAEGVSVPVIFVSVRSSFEDRVQGLNLGADDYLVKPFEYSELVARLRAVERRSWRN